MGAAIAATMRCGGTSWGIAAQICSEEIAAKVPVRKRSTSHGWERPGKPRGTTDQASPQAVRGQRDEAIADR